MGRPLKRKADTKSAALGWVITQLRLKRGMSCQDVAEKVGTDAGYLNSIENGKANPTLKLLQAIADFYDVELWRLIRMGATKWAKG